MEDTVDRGGESDVNTKAKLELGSPKPRNAGSYQKLEEKRMDSLLEPSEGAQPCWYLDL